MRARLRFKPVGNKMLVTDDAGSWKMVTYEEFAKLMAANETLPGYENSTFFINKRSSKKRNDQINRLYRRYPSGPSRFVLKFTNACNYNCVYCQAGSCAENATQMCTLETAKNVVDFMMQCKVERPILEIQGGEPLMNFPVIKDTILYIEEKYGKNKVNLCIMTNLSLMTEEIAKLFKEHRVSIGTSIDGPKDIMDKQRPRVDGTSAYDSTQAGRQLVKDICGYYPGFLSTITKDCLAIPEQIVDLNLTSGSMSYNCRPLFRLGRCIDIWDQLGYTVEEYLEYYRRVVMYMIDKTKADGNPIFELRTLVYLMKILYQVTCDIEVASPCGGVICMCSIDWNGDILACEGSKMLGGQPCKENYILGNVNDPRCSYHTVFFGDKALSALDSMVSHSDAKCSRCPYLPYCGSCAIERTQTDAYSMYQCQICEGQLDFIFQLLDTPKYASVLKLWAESYYNEVRHD